MIEQGNLGGRPESTPEEKEARKTLLLQKIEPYLKSGLSTRKALLESKVANSEFYRLMDEDEGFREQIETFKNFTSVLLNNAIVRELQDILQRQNGFIDENGKKVKSQKLTRDDRKFLQWYAVTSNSTKQEYGERKDISFFDPEAEIQKIKGILKEKTTKLITDA